MTIGQRIRDRRKWLGRSANDVAEKLGVCRQTFYRYETGSIKKIPSHILRRLAEELNTSVDYLLGLPEEIINPLQERNATYETAHTKITLKLTEIQSELSSLLDFMQGLHNRIVKIEE